jgi:uncharacterized transporter YbjL
MLISPSVTFLVVVLGVVTLVVGALVAGFGVVVGGKVVVGLVVGFVVGAKSINSMIDLVCRPDC